MAEPEPIRIARAVVEAFNAGDWDRMRALSAPNAVYVEPATNRRVEGLEPNIEAAQGWKAAFPDVKGTITSSLASGDTAVLEITWEGTQTGDLATPGGTISASGRRATVSAVQVITVADGKVLDTRHYFDLLGMLQQIGALPSAG